MDLDLDSFPEDTRNLFYELGLQNDSHLLNIKSPDFNSSDKKDLLDLICKQKHRSEENNITNLRDGQYCNASSDFIMCWPPTPVNTTAYLKCFSEFLGYKYDDRVFQFYRRFLKNIVNCLVCALIIQAPNFAQKRVRKYDLLFESFHCLFLFFFEHFVEQNKIIEHCVCSRNCFATIPFTSEQDRFIVMAHFRSDTLNPHGNWSYSVQSCIEQFMQQYPDEMIEYDIFKQRKCRLVHRFETKNCICKGKSTGRFTVLTENVIENIQERINRSPKKAVSQLSQLTEKTVNKHPTNRVNEFDYLDINAYGICNAVEKVVQEMKQVKEENRKLKLVVTKQEKRIDSLEREVGRKNVIIKGVVDDEEKTEGNNIKAKISRVLQKMNVNIDTNIDLEQT
ncbi:hypothetical protein FQA39_LY02650 [Lamprigera yunnana]|nr:hypothetical protein FQA39_LY02650 [Lamprigera yunnana]